MSDDQDRCTVNIVTQSSALSKPTFVIKVDNRYYATLAVWEYDPHALDLSPEQKKDIEELSRLFEQTRERGPAYDAVELTNRGVQCYSASKTGAGHGRG